MTEPRSWPFGDLEPGKYSAILADPPWRFRTWNKATAVKKRGSSSTYTSASVHYDTMDIDDLASLPVHELAAANCALFLWVCWPTLLDAILLLEAWGFKYKTCAFDWMKAHVGQIDMFRDDADVLLGMGYWTRANSEPCLLATRGKAKRRNADVRQGIIAPRREHSRKPECVRERIERLVCGPYLELFARQSRPGWDTWGAERTRFDEAAE
jgi:N6-adenosine-specific RNA methylase IME4